MMANRPSSAAHGPRQSQHIWVKILIFATFLLLLGIIIYLVRQRLDAQGIQTGFDFLSYQAGFNISEALIPYDGTDSYGLALLAGLVNTLKVAIVSIFAALFLGISAALLMLSGHGIAQNIGKLYVRIVRNTPLLLQLFFWYGVFSVGLASYKERLTLFSEIHLSNRGLNFPVPDNDLWCLLCLSLVCFIGTFYGARQLQHRGIASLWFLIFGIFVSVLVIISGILFGIGTFDFPVAGKFSIKGGALLTPEFMTLFIGLSVYTGTYIAEALRGAVLAVPQGQTEAGISLGLNKVLTFRLVILPQTVRIAMPAVVSELLNLVKNSSLGVAVGYPDLVSVGNTAMSQTGQAIELISIYMLCYVSLNFLITKISQRVEARYVW